MFSAEKTVVGRAEHLENIIAYCDQILILSPNELKTIGSVGLASKGPGGGGEGA